MAGEHSENPVLFHLDSEIYKNGIKFDRDRTFRNRLTMKTIVLMSVLLITATVMCVTVARSRSTTVLHNETEYSEHVRKESNYYDPESGGSSKDVLQELLRTSFVPPPRALGAPGTGAPPALIKIRNAKMRRAVEIHKSGNGTEGQITSGRALGENSNVKATGRETEKEESVTEIAVHETGKPLEIDNSTERGDRSKKVKELSKFWKEGRDVESIRRTQANRMLSYMDLSADPCHDFYQYACGNWITNNPIPEDKAGYDIFELLRESLDTVLRDLLTEPSDNSTSEAAVKAKDFYASCMNEELLDRRGNEPLFDLTKKLKGWPIIDKEWNSSDFNWVDLVAQIKLYDKDALVSQWIGPDFKNSSDYVIQFDQSGLGLPSKDYFLKPYFSKYLEAYKKYLIRVAILLGAEEEKATSDAQDMIDFEIELAKILVPMEERRNLPEHYMKMSLTELHSVVPQIDWMKYLSVVLNRTVEANETVVTFGLKYFKALVPLVEKTDQRTVSNYILWMFMKHVVNSLDTKFQDAKQEFYYVLFGREKAPPRWTYCVSQVNMNLGMALGSIFVRRYFDESSKNDTVTMTKDVMRAFREILNTTEWIDKETKLIAMTKIKAMQLRIGYPDFILNETHLNEDFSELEISKWKFFENSLNIMLHTGRVEQEKLGEAVNKTEWSTPPTTVNAYYSRSINQIMVPAGILQPPFYHKYFPKSLNYGGIGVAIGHEITHGFDDKGRLFDERGNYHKWWKEETIANFRKRAQCLIDQYSGYKVSEVDMRIDGVNTQGENIADNGGIRQAFKAYQMWLLDHDSAHETLPGINATNIQLFFLNFAQIWCGAIRPEASRNKLKTSQHSPAKFRVLGTLSNSVEFAKAFKCRSNTTMNPTKKCSLW